MQGDESLQRRPLQRGEHNLAAVLPVDPSFIFEESRTTLFGTQQGSQPVTLSASRQRPRFATAQDLDDALLQAIEGKINRKNAWVSKDASNLLEGITHTVESTLDAATVTDEYSSFAKVATVVEGCSKVWTSRVDSTYQRSNQMVRRLLRNEEGGCDGSDDEGNNAGGADSSTTTIAAAERKRKAAQRRAQSVRTIALDPSEINLDSKGRISLVHTGVNAQFRAITEKFDQGNAQGLLLHNAPLGNAGNLILDVDYARETGRDYSARRGRLSADSRCVKRDMETEETSVSAVMEEFDFGFDAPLDLPSFPPPAWAALSTGHSPLSSDEGGGVRVNDGRSSGNGNVKTEDEEEAGRPSITVPSLLFLPHTAPMANDVVGNSHVVASGAQHRQHEGSHYEPGIETSLFPLHQQQPSGYSNNNDDMDGGDGDWGGGMDYDDDNMEIGGGDDVDGSAANNKTLRERVAAEARHLVSGVTELDTIDDCLFGKNCLALEAEDPTLWFPLAEPPVNALRGGVTQNSELLRLHKEHRFTQSSMQLQVTSTSSGKRVKREKTIAFDLPGELAVTAAADNGDGGVDGDTDGASFSISFLLGEGGVESSSLKQSTTLGKNVTPLGKDLLLGKDPNAILVFTQSVVQRTKAQEAGLLLPEPPVPGKSVPSFLPYPITVSTFFQPFSTPLMQWNMLRKSATGRTLALSSNSGQARPSRHAGGVFGNNGWSGKRDDDTQSQFGGGCGDDDDGGGSGSGVVGAMPVEFFHGGAEADDEFMGAGGYDDYENDGGDYDKSVDYLREVEAQIMSSFERSELARLSTALTVLSDGRRSGADELNGIDPMALAKVLHSPQTALPSQVNVVRLRQAMWSSLSDMLRHDPSSRKQKTRGEQHRKVGHKRSRTTTEEEINDDDEGRDSANSNGSSDCVSRFSNIVLSVLPQVPLISATGTLSPAFFFFSILFLANEHGVVLESVPGLDDLIVRGVNRPDTSADVK